MEENGYIHFFSCATRVSIELPIGFEEQLEDPETNSAIYADDLDDGEMGARIMTKMVAVPAEATDAFRSLAAASARAGSRTVAHHDERVVDGAPAVRQILRYYDEDGELDLFRHETFAQTGNVVFSIVCLALDERKEEYLPSFDHAADTARFILLPAKTEEI